MQSLCKPVKRCNGSHNQSSFLILAFYLPQWIDIKYSFSRKKISKIDIYDLKICEPEL